VGVVVVDDGSPGAADDGVDAVDDGGIVGGADDGGGVEAGG
jgi:hypothetical protein